MRRWRGERRRGFWGFEKEKKDKKEGGDFEGVVLGDGEGGKG